MPKNKKRKYPLSHYIQLKKIWLKKHKLAKRQVLLKHGEAIDWLNGKIPSKENIAGAAVGAMMLSNTLPAMTAVVTPPVTASSDAHVDAVDRSVLLQQHLAALVPEVVRPLSKEEESLLSQALSSDFGFDVSAELDGKKLNRSFGYIGAEQHLMRYPGDFMYSHLQPEEASNHAIFSSGMAPGRGAWGYFAKSKSELRSLDIEREKWYIAVPTFLAPGFYENVKSHYEWFKYRKMLVINPKTGQSVVVDIGDAGPAQWTGKHLGGSPEVMIALGLEKGPRKGAVLYFFIDDRGDKISLGPIKPGEII
jgi:hypothetical protein